MCTGNVFVLGCVYRGNVFVLECVYRECVCTSVNPKAFLCLDAHAQPRYTVVCLCVCRLLQLLKDQ